MQTLIRYFLKKSHFNIIFPRPVKLSLLPRFLGCNSVSNSPITLHVCLYFVGICPSLCRHLSRHFVSTSPVSDSMHRPPHLLWLSRPTNIQQKLCTLTLALGEDFKLCNTRTQLCNFLHPLAVFILGPNIILGTLSVDAVNVPSSSGKS